jgi:DnaJ-domain-containing protein 1
MDGYELIVVVVFFLVGYWAVDFFWPKRKIEAGVDAQAQPGESPAPAGGAAWHEILGVSPDATPEQIRRAYEEKSALCGPSLATGIGPKSSEAAIRATRRINDAYAEALRGKSRI